MTTSQESFTEPQIFHKVSQLYRAAHERVIRFPKTSRHSLGTRVEDVLIEILELLYLAQGKQSVSRLMILNKADVKLKILSAHVRLALATRCINDAGFAELSTLSVEIGRMLGGWIKATKTRED